MYNSQKLDLAVYNTRSVPWKVLILTNISEIVFI